MVMIRVFHHNVFHHNLFLLFFRGYPHGLCVGAAVSGVLCALVARNQTFSPTKIALQWPCAWAT